MTSIRNWKLVMNRKWPTEVNTRWWRQNRHRKNDEGRVNNSPRSGQRNGPAAQRAGAIAIDTDAFSRTHREKRREINKKRFLFSIDERRLAIIVGFDWAPTILTCLDEYLYLEMWIDKAAIVLAKWANTSVYMQSWAACCSLNDRSMTASHSTVA